MLAKSTAPVRDRLLCLVHCLLSFAKRGKGETWATLGLVILCRATHAVWGLRWRIFREVIWNKAAKLPPPHAQQASLALRPLCLERSEDARKQSVLLPVGSLPLLWSETLESYE